MPRFAIHTEETVHGIYHIEAEDDAEARRLFEDGSVGDPSLYEAISAEIENVELLEL